MTMPTRLAAAAVIGVLAVGGALYLLQAAAGVGPPSPTPGASASPGLPAGTPARTQRQPGDRPDW